MTTPKRSRPGKTCRQIFTAFENATRFFHACESAYGWDACREYVADGATFTAQCEPLVDIDTVQGYSEWMTAVVENATPGATYVYYLTMDADDKIEKMVKVSNAPWMLRELGWM